MNKITFSPIITGTMTWGVWGKNCNTKQMVELMHTCIENNITSFDHADIYGDYTTEAAFGKAFAESKIDRQKVQFISKCGIQMQNNARKNAVKHYDYSKDYIILSVEQSLKNLQTDYIDLLLLHRPSPLTQADEIAEAIEQLKRNGKISPLAKCGDGFCVLAFYAANYKSCLCKVEIRYRTYPYCIYAQRRKMQE
jgi:predicted oxidoreductase